MKIFHNTCVMAGLSRSPDMGFLDACFPERPRQVFNNMHLHLGRLPALTGPTSEAAIYDGNLYWTPEADEKQAAQYFAKFRAAPAFELSKKAYAPGLHSASRVADPRFLPAQIDDPIAAFDLAAGSPAINAGVELPPDLPDPLRKADADRPDIGAIPQGMAWKTGRR
jgi:hypothetical protein